jgi:hypothetical protein
MHGQNHINYHCLLRNDPEKRGSFLLRDGSLKSCVLFVGFVEKSLQMKGGYTWRIARWYCGCCCQRKKSRRSTQTNKTRRSLTSCKVHWGERKVKIKLAFSNFPLLRIATRYYLYFRTTLSRQPIRIKHMFIWTFFSHNDYHTVTSQNTDLSSWISSIKNKTFTMFQ